MRVDDEAGPFSGVNLTLYDRTGHRKYLTAEEREAFRPRPTPRGSS